MSSEEFIYTLYPNGDAAWMGEYRGPLLSVVYDRECSVLLKHGSTESVTRWYETVIEKFRESGNADLADDLVLVSIDTRIVGVDWLNYAISHSGTIAQTIAEMMSKRI